jgi:hypothetical protein
LHNIIQKCRVQNKGKRAILKGQFHISTEELRLQVVEVEAATTAAQKSKVSTTLQATQSTIDLIDDSSEEELSDDDIDELGL